MLNVLSAKGKSSQRKPKESSVGNVIRCLTMIKPLPRPIYYEGGWIHFKRDGDKINYYVMLWSSDGKVLATMKTGEYKGQPKEELLKDD